ncbi:RNA-directed DNA polymerase (reverse transcriptase)-related family protein [Rhynchospora pubera]|uniref:RNA-directed DNA polymerase (Reverse transcriptase)-related family protein n=1 Tax=Rhynchospora pubera TaxID=906938 RepID=A0AAV8CHA6_9POAL|nr:RNA-directed DNA polymerase (reverse transcriptase)-related family protein [Rhynchospora pubera]
MESFGEVSGLVINPAKSKLWLSKRCDEQHTQMVQGLLRADVAGTEEKYLGVLLSRTKSAKKNALMLMEKLKLKLTGWKTKMLSHAGRLVLLKSVLMSLPVYYMSVEVLPKCIIKQMESLIAKFFWGKTDQMRYLSFVAWKKICQPFERGGLGVRQLEIFGDALFLKLVWAMISQDEKIWVQVCKGKYYNNMGFWRSINVAGASPLWRQTVKMRDFFKENVKWQLVDGKKVEVMSQPWYTGWQVADQASRGDRRIKVADLFDKEADDWNEAQMTRLLGVHATAYIVQNVEKLQEVEGLTDKLIWEYNKAGNYTVKDGYECSIMRSGMMPDEISWKEIWKWQGIAPKVKIFMWRLLANALPLAQNMHMRIQSISPMCARCQQENEYATHCFFFCPGSRMVWFGGQLGIRTDSLPIDIREAVHYVTQGMNENNIRIFCYTLWEIWLTRNDFCFETKQFDPTGVCMKIRSWNSKTNGVQNQNTGTSDAVERRPYEIPQNSWQVIVDASWEVSKKAGAAYLVYREGMLHSLGLDQYEADDPFMAEAMALQFAVHGVRGLLHEQENQPVHFLIDCLNLAEAVQQHETDNIPSWRARYVVAHIERSMAELGDASRVRYVRREAVKPAHDLANHARRMGVRYQGIPTVLLMCQHNIGMNIDPSFFQQVLEAPP